MFRVDPQFVLGDDTLVSSFTYSDILKNTYTLFWRNPEAVK